MKVLHYGIGLQPNRTGGLVKYSEDIVEEENRVGVEAYFLYPRFSKKRTGLFKDKQHKMTYYFFTKVPLPILGPSSNLVDYMDCRNHPEITKFLKYNNFDVLHIHSLMGLPLDFIKRSKTEGLKIVYTTHDYFGLSPVPKFYLAGANYADRVGRRELFWRFSTYFGRNGFLNYIIQSNYFYIFKKIRYLIPIFLLKKKLSPSSIEMNFFPENTKQDDTLAQSVVDYFNTLFSLIDFFHFNSSVAKCVFEKNLPFTLHGDIIPVTSQNVQKNDSLFIEAKKIKNILFIGEYTEEKGIFEYIHFANEHRKEYSFFIAGDTKRFQSDNITNLGKYSQKDLKTILNNIDLVVLPSLWDETFGLVGLEALSYGKKVIAARNVGFSDILPENLVFDNLLSANIAEIENVRYETKSYNIDEHVKNLITMYKKVLINYD